MNKSIALALFAGGVVLLLIGINANSINPDVSLYVTASTTDKTMLMTACGVVLTFIGLIGSLRGVRN